MSDEKIQEVQASPQEPVGPSKAEPAPEPQKDQEEPEPEADKAQPTESEVARKVSKVFSAVSDDFSLIKYLPQTFSFFLIYYVTIETLRAALGYSMDLESFENYRDGVSADKMFKLWNFLVHNNILWGGMAAWWMNGLLLRKVTAGKVLVGAIGVVLIIDGVNVVEAIGVPMDDIIEIGLAPPVGALFIGMAVTYACMGPRKGCVWIALLLTVTIGGILTVCDLYAVIRNSLPPILRGFLVSIINKILKLCITRGYNFCHRKLWRPGMSYLLPWAIACLCTGYTSALRILAICAAVNGSTSAGVALRETFQICICDMLSELEGRNHIFASGLNRIGILGWAPSMFILDMRRQTAFIGTYAFLIPLAGTIPVQALRLAFGVGGASCGLLERWEFWVAIVVAMFFSWLTDFFVVRMQREPGEKMGAAFWRLHTAAAHKPFFKPPAKHADESVVAFPSEVGDMENLDLRICGRRIPEMVLLHTLVFSLTYDFWISGWRFIVSQLVGYVDQPGQPGSAHQLYA